MEECDVRERYWGIVREEGKCVRERKWARERYGEYRRDLRKVCVWRGVREGKRFRVIRGE